MARNAAESREITALFRAAKVPLFVAFYRRALPRNLRAREIVRGGELGTITDVTVTAASPQPVDLYRRAAASRPVCTVCEVPSLVRAAAPYPALTALACLTPTPHPHRASLAFCIVFFFSVLFFVVPIHV